MLRAPRAVLEHYSETIPRAIRQGREIHGFIEQHREWIADGDPKSETVHRYRTLLHAMKEVWRLARMERDAYHPFVIREGGGAIAGLATVYIGVAIRHPDMPHFLTGADIDYTLPEAAGDQMHLDVAHALLGAVGRLTVHDNLAGSPKEASLGLEFANRTAREVSAFAVVPVHHMEVRKRGFELACNAGDMARIEEPASLTVPEAYAHPYIDFAKGGQLSQLYYSPAIGSL